VRVFDELFVDNCIMTSSVVSKNFLLDLGEDRRVWNHDGVHVAAVRSISQRGVVKYEFTALSWKMLYSGRFDRAGRLDARRSRITWVSDHGEQRGDRGQTARHELNRWLANALADDLPA
jgi:hypothetical protein